MDQGGEGVVERERAREAYVARAKEFCEKQVVFEFPGIEPDVLSKLMAEEDELRNANLEIPLEITPIKDLMERFGKEGIKVVLGTDPDSGNVFIVPAKSEVKDIEANSIFPRQLRIAAGMDEKLAGLIRASREFRSLFGHDFD